MPRRPVLIFNVRPRFGGVNSGGTPEKYYTGLLGGLPGLETCRRGARPATSGGLLGHIFAGFLGPARLGQGAAAAHGEVAESLPDQVDCRVQGGGAGGRVRRGSG